jgi:outer membrane protein assembly factor BamB
MVLALSGPADYIVKDPFTVYAHDANTGALVWEQRFTHVDGVTGSYGYFDAFSDLVVYGTSTSLTVLNIRDGQALWSGSPDSYGGFVAGDDKLFVTTDSLLKAFDLATGAPLWESAGPIKDPVKPQYDPTNDVVVGSYANHYYVYSADTGSLVADAPPLSVEPGFYGWNRGWIEDGKLFYGDRVFDVMTGKRIWSQLIPSIDTIAIQTIDQTVLLRTYDGAILQNLTDFAEIWQYTGVGPDGQTLHTLSDPVYLHPNVYMWFSDASLRAIDAVTGHEVGKWWADQMVDRSNFETPFIAALTVGNGKLYVSFGTDRLCTFGE